MTKDAADLLESFHLCDGRLSDAVVRRPEGFELERLGLIERVKPKAPYLPYAQLTAAGKTRFK